MLTPTVVTITTMERCRIAWLLLLDLEAEAVVRKVDRVVAEVETEDILAEDHMLVAATEVLGVARDPMVGCLQVKG